MKKLLVIFTLLIACVILDVNTNLVNADQISNKSINVSKSSNGLIIKYKNNQTDNSNILKSFGNSNIKSIHKINEKLSVIQPESDSDKKELLNKLKQDPNVEKVEEDKVIKIKNIPNDPSYGEQWYVPDTNFDKLWNYNIVSKKNVTVAVIDSGINYNHEDLKNVIADGGYNFYDDNTDVYDDNGHGTEVSGVIAASANNGVGIAGLDSNMPIKILPLKTADSNGDTLLSDLITAVDYAITKKADVINLSMGSNTYSSIENDEIQKAISSGIVVVAAAGNDGDSAYNYPASYDNVISVGATDSNDNLAYFSNYNNKVSLTAPGEEILTTNISGGYDYCSGTSFSSPIVASMAAIIKSTRPDLTPQEIKNVLQNSAEDLGAPGKDNYFGYGKVDADKCINSILDPQAISIKPNNITVGINQSAALSASITPDNAIDKNIIWSSGDDKIAQVDTNGNVKGVSKGTVTITAKTELGNLVATASVNVVDTSNFSVQYQAQVQNIGWQNSVYDGAEAGTEGRSLRMEALKVSLVDAPAGAQIKYQAHVQNLGWQNWVYDGAEAGTEGKSFRMEALRMVLENAPGYSIAYQVQVQNTGWQNWVYDGQIAGTTGLGLRVEAIRIKIIKTSDAPAGVSYSTHVQNIGWQQSVRDGELAGTEGQSLRVEALKVNLVDAPTGARIKYQTYVQNIGWQDWVYDGTEAGTDGKGFRIEAVRLVLENASGYSIAYRTHVQNIGWQGWVYDGATSGTMGKALRIEGLEIKVIKNN